MRSSLGASRRGITSPSRRLLTITARLTILFPPISSKQFPAFYQRSPMKNQYRSYMRAKMPYTKQR